MCIEEDNIWVVGVKPGYVNIQCWIYPAKHSYLLTSYKIMYMYAAVNSINVL